MSEIAKLRQRLENVSKHATEYRMTVVEAKELLLEIDKLQKEEPPEVVINEPRIITRKIDAGGFK